MSNSNLSVGWIGAGRMGAAMAVRLARAGVKPRGVEPHPVQGGGDRGPGLRRRRHDRRPARQRRRVHDGVHPGRPGAGAARRGRPAGRPGAPARRGGRLLDRLDRVLRARCARPCAAAGVDFLAAPVSGNGKVVAAGRLTLVVSGPRTTYDKVAHLLGHIGKSVTYVGEGDTARLVKICHNLMLGVVAQTMAEITVLAEKGGMSRAAFLEFLNESVMGSTFTRYKSPAYVHLDYTPTFTPVLLRKDFDLGLAAAPRARRADAGGGGHRAAGAGDASAPAGSSEDFAVLLDQQAAASGLELTPEDDAGRRRARRGPESDVVERPRRWPAPGHMGVDYETGSTSTGCASTGWPAPRQSLEASELRRVPAVRLLQHPLHHADLDRRRARRQDDPLRAADPGRRARCCGTSARPPGTTSSTRPGWPRTNCRAGMLGLRGAVAPTAGLMEDAVREIKGMLDRRRRWPTSRSAWTSSSRRSCSRCSGRA